jgi:sec-independent protein translocase protein TatA
MNIGIWQIVIVAVVLIVLFGRGKISGIMGDVAEGIKSFKKGIKDEEEPSAADKAKSISKESEEVVADKADDKESDKIK